ncbi:MAG: hypothetical protein Phog2KO_38010 [Phototrophicaceae bacterium]
MTQEKIMIVTGVSPDGVDPILEAIASAGGGIVGDYTHCAFTNDGFGRFKPSTSAQPHVGDIDAVNKEAEVRIETFCPRAIGKQVVQAIREAHPYEEPVIYIIPLLSEDDL